jgi:hypothetical protein
VCSVVKKGSNIVCQPMAYQASRRLQILPPLAARTAPASGAAFAGVARLQQDSGGQSRAEQSRTRGMNYH